MGSGEAVAARARALVGSRFRAQGRGREGVDCIGLVAAALGRADVRRDYALRGGCPARLEAELEGAGLVPGQGVEPGDVLVMRVGPGQLHLGVWTGGGLVHADAGLRRVVERPGEVPWPVVGVWRLG
jgi:cell wall-associated NlpC family hydrolase